DLEDIVRHEVRAILRADPTLSVADCTAKCDAEFAMTYDRDETLFDRMCARECA
ncbi:hypothetical protein BaRGS_00015070, partial [Batillaria attramentaria]